MRRSITWVLALAVLLTGLPLWAQEASVSEEVKPLSGYEGGFFVRTADDAFRLKVKGTGKFTHHYLRNPGVPDVNSIKYSAALLFQLKLFKDFEVSTLLIQASGPAGTAAPAAPEWYTWADYTPIPEFGVEVGAVTLPMDRQGEASGSQMGMTARPITATQTDGKDGQSGKVRTIARQSFGLPTTLGIRLFGDIKRFHYAVGFGNGDDWNGANATKAFAYGARLAFDILEDPGLAEFDLENSEKPKLQVGVGTSIETQDAVDAHINNVTLDRSLIGSADASFKWRGFSIVNEWYWRKLKVKTANFTLDDVGYYVDAGYFVLPKKVEIVARGAQLFREGPDNNAYEFGGGVNWYIHGNNVKLQLDYSRLLDFDDTEGQGHKAFDRIRTALTLRM